MSRAYLWHAEHIPLCLLSFYHPFSMYIRSKSIHRQNTIPPACTEPDYKETVDAVNWTKWCSSFQQTFTPFIGKLLSLSGFFKNSY